jgi:lipoprotein-anchoring transpeptidase ErfK/SrfK
MNQLRHPPSRYHLILTALAAPLLLGLSACTEVSRFFARPEPKPATESQPDPQVAEAPDPIPKPQEKPKRGQLYEWSGDGRKISRIVVNTDEQKARFYDGDEQIGWTTVASGVSKYPTPTGHFEVMEKVANKRSNLYGKIYGSGGKVVHSNAKVGRDQIPAGARFEGAKMPYFMRLTNDGIGLHAGPIPRPGRPASHGCIRMPGKFAPVLYEHVDIGTQVSIVGSGPSYGNYVQKQRAFAARERERREAAAREQAIAAASGTAERQGSPASPTAGGTPPTTDGAPAQPADVRAAPIATAHAPSSPHGNPDPQPVEARPATVDHAAAQTDTARLVSQPSADVPVPSASAAAQPNAPGIGATPSASSPASIPASPQGVPGTYAPIPWVAPPPYYAPPMLPAAALAPTPAPEPATAPVGTVSPTASPTADPSPSAPSAAPEAASSEAPGSGTSPE